MGGFFITGTNTEVGKTFVTSLLLRSLAALGFEAVGYKPVACGSREDAERLLAASCSSPSGSGRSSRQPLTLDEVNPLSYRVPAAPLAAAMIENRPVDWNAMLDGAAHLAKGYPLVLCEGVGGWKVPCTAERTMADFATDLGWPVIVVVDNRLGALNHTLLTLESIGDHGLDCAGVILNHPEAERDAASISNAAVLAQVTRVPILAEIMHDQAEIDLPASLLPENGGGQAG